MHCMTNLSQCLFSSYVILSNVSCNFFPQRFKNLTRLARRKKSCSMQPVPIDTGEGAESFWMGVEGSTRHEPLSRRKINQLRCNQWWRCSYKILEVSCVWHAKKKKKPSKKIYLKGFVTCFIWSHFMINLVSV